MRLILASQSPRRKELMKLLNRPFDIYPSSFDEEKMNVTTPVMYVQNLAKEKAKAVASKHADAIVIGADTIVVVDEKIFGKPHDKEEAYHMLKQLSGRTHQVYTAVSLQSNGVEHTFYEKTDVTFFSLSDEEMTAYMNSGEPFDKAGAYGIQGYGALFVKEIAGDYYSVVGLPIARVNRELLAFESKL